MTATLAGLFPASTSILSPVLVGLHDRDRVRERAEVALLGAAAGVPTTLPTLRVVFQGQRKPQNVVHRRTVCVGNDAAGNRVFRLCDLREGEQPSSGWDHWRWQVSTRVAEHDPHDPGLEGVEATILPEVSHFRLSGGQVDSAPQLALLRHLAVEGLRALDPGCQVVGGQHDWDGRWWPSPAGDPSPSQSGGTHPY